MCTFKGMRGLSLRRAAGIGWFSLVWRYRTLAFALYSAADQWVATHFYEMGVFRQVTEQCCEADSWLPADSDCREAAVDTRPHPIHEARFV
jgi:hypothetical protein